MKAESHAPDGSVVRMASSRPDLLAFEVRDKITKPDIEWMSSIAKTAMNERDETDMLIIMRKYEGSKVGARLDGYAISVQTRSLAHIRRYAVVGAPALARVMIAISGAVTPVETKTFSLEDEKAAWRWVNEGLPERAPTKPAGPNDLDNPTPS